jgi:hypothetical protein
MDYARGLRRQLEVSLQPKLTKNPLHILGFSPELLKLGLSEDELYEYMYSTARLLFARMHPDRGNEEIEEQQRRVSEAFSLLKDRQLFSIWLRDLRDEVSEERAEITRIRKAHRDLQEVATQHRKEAAQNAKTLQSVRRGLTTTTGRFRTYLLTRNYELREGRVFSVGQDLTITVLRFGFHWESECTLKMVRAHERRGERLFLAPTLSKSDLEKVPGAPDAQAVEIGFESLRRLLSGRSTKPVVAVNFQTLVSKGGRYEETTHYLKGSWSVVGSVLPSDLSQFPIGSEAINTKVPYDTLLPILSGEIYPGVLLVTDDVSRSVARGDSIELQLNSLRRRLVRPDPGAFVTDIVVDVRSNDCP